MARSALTGLATDSPPEAIAALTRFGRPWQLLVAFGDSYYDRKDWAKAVPVYEEALDDMRDTAANPKAPPEEIERRVYKRAVEARALAPTYVVTRQFRGRKTGLADPNFRNFTTEAVPVPVRFETDSAALTADGVAAVEDIYAYVSAAAPDYVAIVGHTDPRGSDAHNDDLSLRRATTVRDRLIKLGYGGKIETIGRGERERFVPDDPSKYSEDELFAFDRRVEYRVK
jgi:outer membrane protein OmpA-like peptidoglycan-associated protein